MAAPGLSKYDLDPQLFKPEPPVQPAQVRQQFCGREKEFARGLGGLKAGLDLRGKRSRKLAKRPWVIHGESRSGKSHLARRIFAQLPDDDHRLQFRIGACERLDAITVMRELFEDLRGRFISRIFDQRLAEDPTRLAEVHLVRQLVEKIALLGSGAQSVTLTLEQSDTQSDEAGVEIGGTWLAKFVAKFQTERSQKTALQLCLRSPTATDLAEVCGIMAETLLRQGLIDHVLVLMDDVDLLEGYVCPEKNAREQRSLLADAIAMLHSAPGVDVVLTARSWYAHSHKELQTLVDLAVAEKMPAKEMVGIHDLRLKACARKRGVAAFLTRDALSRLANDVDGLPGVFLQHLHTAFYQFQDEDDPGPRDYEWLVSFFRRRWAWLRDKCTTGCKEMEQAVSDGRLTVDVTERNPFYGTMLENEYAYQSYYSETMYFISGFMRSVLSPTVGVGS